MASPLALVPERLTAVATAPSNRLPRLVLLVVTAPLIRAAPPPARAGSHPRHDSAPRLVGNNCGGGKLLPDIYLLGTRSAATASVYDDLARSSLLATVCNESKSWQLCQEPTSQGLHGHSTSKQWLKGLPDCPGKSAVLSDFKDTNLFSVPKPSEFSWSGQFNFGAKGRDPEHGNAARRMSCFYQQAGGRQPKLLVMLQEPLARMTSEWSHTQPFKNCRGCLSNATFRNAFAVNVKLLRRRRLTDWLWKSFYARQIHEYLQYFNESQFIFVPEHQYDVVSVGRSAALLQRLGVRIEPSVEVRHQNKHPVSPALNSDLTLDPSALATYQELMVLENELLVKTLARAQLGDAWLMGYTGAPGNATEIWAWLEKHW